MERTNKSLFNITAEHQKIISEIEMMEGEITPENEKMLEINSTELQVKSIAYLSVIKHKDAINALIDEEIKRLQALKKRNSNIVERLKSSLLHAVNVFGDIETKFNRFTTRKSQSIEVDDVNSLPKEYKVTTVTERADKAKLKKALKDGEAIEGVRLVDNKNLKIN